MRKSCFPGPGSSSILSDTSRTCIIFRSLGGEPIDDNYETKVCGIPQLETVDLQTLSLFKSRTDLACLRDLLNAK